jgi:membrane fusion protein
MTVLLFRQEVIDAGRERLAGTVIAATPPRAKLYVWLLLAVALALAAILAFGQYPRRAQVTGIVAYDAGIARVYPSSLAEIRQIHVKEGMVVPAGAPLVTLSLAQGPGGIGNQISELSRQDDALARQEQLAAQLGTSETRTLDQQKASVIAGIASLTRQHELMSAQMKLAQRATERAVRLAAEGAGTQRQVEDSRSAFLARRSEMESVNERLIGQRETLRAIDGQIAQRSIEASRAGADLAGQRAALAEQRADLARRDQLTLTAPIGGEVSDIASEVGQRATPERSLVTIVPRGSKLEVWLYAPSRAVGFVKVGQSVRLFFDAFPYQKYGAGRGRVIAVSRVPVQAGASDAKLDDKEPMFRIRVAIDQAVPKLAAARTGLRPGMTLSANLILERRRLWEVLFNPIAAALKG